MEKNEKKPNVDYVAIIREFEHYGRGRSLRKFCTENGYVYQNVVRHYRRYFVSIRPSTGAKPLYTLIAAVPIHLIVVVAIVLLNLYVAASVSSQIPPFILSKHSPDAATSIYGEADLIAPHGLPFCNRVFVR